MLTKRARLRTIRLNLWKGADMGEVVILDVETSLDLPADRVLDAAKASDLSTAMVIGYEQDGSLYIGTTTTSAKEMVWLMEQAKKLILDQFDHG